MDDMTSTAKTGPEAAGHGPSANVAGDDELSRQVQQLRKRLDSAQERNLALTRELEEVYASRSWRVTAPLRRALHIWHVEMPGSRRLGAGGLGCKQWGIRLLHRLAGIGWLRLLALRVLNRFPGIKHRLQRLLAQAHDQAFLPVRGHAPEADFEDMLPPQRSLVYREVLQRRDTLLPRSALLASIGGLRLQGHTEGSYSLAAVNRHLLSRLEQDVNLPLRLVPQEGALSHRVHRTPGGQEEVKHLNRLVKGADWESVPLEQRVALYHHYPPISAPDPEQGLPVALFFWEESEVPASIIDTFNSGYAGIVVTAWYVKKVLMDSGCRVPVEVVTLPLVPNADMADASPDDLTRVSERGVVRLLHVSSCFPRKGVDVLLTAFDQLAARRRDVELTLKTFPNPHNHVESWIQQLVRPEHRSRLTLIMEDYDASAMAALYRDHDVVVLPTRGEGLNMPGIEAGEFGRMLVVTGHGAHLDFADEHNSLHIAYRFAPAQSHLAQGLSTWSDPSPGDLAKRLNTVCGDLLAGHKAPLECCSHLYQHIHERFLGPQASDSFLTGLWRIKRFHQASEQGAGEAPKLGINLVTTWGEACGIAEYSRFIAEELLKYPVSLRILAPIGRVTAPDDLAGQVEVQEEWLHGQSPDIHLCELEGDIVWLQHHFAFYSLDRRLGDGAAALRQQGKAAYITLHTTRPLLGFEKGRQQSAAACLASFERVFIHTLDDLNTLKRIGITDNVTLMPQGVSQPAEAAKPNHAGATPPRLLGSFGFLLPHKGVAQLIEAFSLARTQGVLEETSRLRLVTAVRDDSTSPHELERCRRLVTRLGLEEAVEWYTDFLPLDEVTQLLGECDLLVLPYQFTNESSSAAVRTAVAACPNVATTPAPIFDEVRGITWPIDGFGSEDIAKALGVIGPVAGEHDRQKVQEAREAWLSQRRWDKLAERYYALLSAGAVDRQLSQKG